MKKCVKCNKIKQSKIMTNKQELKSNCCKAKVYYENNDNCGNYFCGDCGHPCKVSKNKNNSITKRKTNIEELFEVIYA